jgi:hypothetical protein
MNPDLKSFLDSRLPFPGLVGWSGRAADRALSSGTFAEGFTAAKLEQVLTPLALAAESLRSQGINPVHLCWVFQEIRLYFALRPDGACLALFVQNRSDVPPGSVERLLAEYIQLQE